MKISLLAMAFESTMITLFVTFLCKGFHTTELLDTTAKKILLLLGFYVIGKVENKNTAWLLIQSVLL